MDWRIGDIVKDADGNVGVVCIVWNDGDICSIENDTAHSDPRRGHRDDISNELLNNFLSKQREA